MAICFVGSFLGALLLPACAGPGSGSGGKGGSGGSGGSSGTGGSAGSAGSGGSASGGISSKGGSGGETQSTASGGSGVGGSGGAAGSTGAGGTAGKASGGAGGGAGAGGTTGGGGSAGSRTGGAGGGGDTGSAGAGGGGAGGSTGIDYKLPPPDPCHANEYFGWWDESKQLCMGDNASINCGGKERCQTINACKQSTKDRPGADVTFMCQRNLLFSAEMEQAVVDDGLTGFHYAVVGHDADKSGIDGNTADTPCCQCYQLVYAYPGNDRQVLANPDDPNNKESAIPVPPPLIVQSFNLGATTETFDVYMPAGGLGQNNGCYPIGASVSASGEYMYTNYPPDGQANEGGVKPATWSECRTKDKNWFTVDSFNQPACQQRLTAACNKLTSSIPGLTEESRAGCLKANSLESFYHLNWAVYAAKVECPENLTRVTGCKLAPQGLPAVMKDVKTAAQASANSTFWKKTGGGNYLYQTTTMEDCCRPSCASTDNIAKAKLKPDSQYNVFYSCDAKGVPYTKSQ